MQITCKCLNVIIEVRDQNYGSIDKSLGCILGNDPFFKEDIATVDLKSVIKKYPTLIEVYNCGPWVVHRCLNCEIYTYAYNQETSLSTNTIIINKSLVNDPKEISAIMQSERFSPVFKVIVNEEDTISSISTANNNREIYSKLLSWIEEQTALTEERVKSYVTTQYEELEKLKIRAHKDHVALSRVISQIEENSERTLNNMLLIRSQKIQSPITPKEDIKMKNSVFSSNGTSLDIEGMFPLDDVEECTFEDKHEEDFNSDVSDPDEVILQYKRPGKRNIAQSLPVPVPQFIQRKHQNKSSSETPQVPTDIAASIKALAKSVHGDAIFGELPRPRFSTHL